MGAWGTGAGKRGVRGIQQASVSERWPVRNMETEGGGSVRWPIIRGQTMQVVTSHQKGLSMDTRLNR